MNTVFALAGNQNSGKTTLFNRLTGSSQHVGNFPGVTVEKKEGQVRKMQDTLLADLPGIYSLSPYTAEEVVTRDFILNGHVAGMVNIVDATNLERGLYLSLQLMELEQPMVIALNMMDEVQASGNSIDVPRLSRELGVPVIPISAGKNQGIGNLLLALKKMKQGKIPLPEQEFCTGAVRRAVDSVVPIIRGKAQGRLPLCYAAVKLIEEDAPVVRELGITENERRLIAHIAEGMEQELHTDRQAAIADMRYRHIERLCRKCVVKRRETKGQVRSEKIDQILTHRYFGIPIFFLIMFLMFTLTFSVFGAPMQDAVAMLIGSGTGRLSQAMESVQVHDWVISLVVDGICAGIGSVLSFLPVIVLLFFFLSLLEDSGYMARVAFVMDELLRKIGLSGRSFVPMLIGFGCSVPAIMATRTLPGERDRKMTILLVPFLSCSAKLPIYGMITMAFFPSTPFDWGIASQSAGAFVRQAAGYTRGGLVMVSVYLLGILTAILSGLLLKSTVFRGKEAPFVLELPAYRIPSIRSVALHMWEKAQDFLKRAFTMIFAASIVIWFLQSFDCALHPVQDSADSILAGIGSWIAPVFKPLGFSNWRASTALITGVIAKEMVVSTFSVLSGAGTDAGLAAALQGIFTPLSACAFLTFTVLYMPCAAAFAAAKRELGSWRSALGAVLYQTGCAYLMGMLVYQIGMLVSRWV